MSLMFDSVSSTTTAHDSTPAPTIPLVWQLVFDGVWLARRNGRFAGMAQGAEGETVKLTDEHGNLCGLYSSMNEARLALVDRT